MKMCKKFRIKTSAYKAAHAHLHDVRCRRRVARALLLAPGVGWLALPLAKINFELSARAWLS